MNKSIELFSFYFGEPSRNLSFKEFNNSEYVILGHFTSSFFLKSILEDGLKAPNDTGFYSNDDMFKDEDKYYIYLAAHFDRVFSENAVKKFGGEKILLLLKVKKDTLELDDLNNMYSSNNINLNCDKAIYKALTQDTYCQCRTKRSILPEQIIEVLNVDKIMNTKLSNDESFINRNFLPLSELKNNIDIELIKYKNY